MGDAINCEIEQHFKLSAGPGAGKTFWLIKHIKKILAESTRLENARKIACITFTNIAVRTIQDRLDNSLDQVEVSTIHSFLYKHIVKPYSFKLKEKFDLNLEKFDGHDDYIVTGYKFIDEWKNTTNQKGIKDHSIIGEALKKARWRFDEHQNLIVKPDYPVKYNGKFSIRNDSYFEYKKMAWRLGVVHHDDILFFSYYLVTNFPMILDVIRSKFPYFLVDEFQDTHPIQASILKQIAMKETVVGVIGDIAQSIYGFQGAEPVHFEKYHIDNLEKLVLDTNYRSSDKIVNLLNAIRSDIAQVHCSGIVGCKPKILIGELEDTVDFVSSDCNDGNFYSLSRDNLTSNALKILSGLKVPQNLLNKIQQHDSNSERRKLVFHATKAIVLAKNHNLKEARKELLRIIKKNNVNDPEKRAFELLLKLMNEYDSYSNSTLFDYIDYLSQTVYTVAALKKGKAKDFYSQHTFYELATGVSIVDDFSAHKTIHKAKGAEFNNVLVIMNKEDDLELFLNPNLDDDEEHRIFYVAVSRAINKVFISIPSLELQKEAKLNSYFEICRL